MNITNIALVRATNEIPVNGIVHPVSEVPYLRKEHGTEFSYAMNDLLKRHRKLKEIDWTKPEEISEINKENSKILDEYMPYNSEYNSMVLWSINGLVPDDMNNTFSNLPCAIVEGLEEQINHPGMLTLMPTDTAIKGNVKLSSQASILINKEKYEGLSEEEKAKLTKLNIVVFEGDLRDAVDKTLIQSGRYTAEKLSLRREDDGYIESDTSGEIRKTIEDVANEKGIPQVLHWNVVTGQNDEKEKLSSVKDEFKNMGRVTDFYKQTFFTYLFTHMDIDKRVKGDAEYMPESAVYMEALCDEIERIGLDEYKKILDNYNLALETLRENGNLPKPQQIVDAVKSNEDLGLNNLIEETINTQNKEEKVTMKTLVENALTEQSIGIDEVNAAESIETKERQMTLNKGVSLDE